MHKSNIWRDTYKIWFSKFDLEQGKSEGFDSCGGPSILSYSNRIQMWPWLWWMTLKNNRTPLLYYIKLCASFQSHQSIQTWITAQKHSIRVKNGKFLSRVTLKYERWPWKTIGHYTMSSFVHHLKAIGEFKLEIQYRNTQFGSKSVIFLSRVTLKFDRWPWKTIGHLFYATSSFMHHLIAISEFKLELQFGNSQFGSKSTIFLCSVTLKFGGLPWQTIRHLSNGTWSFVNHFIAICEFKLVLQSRNC